ncbi:hypothetical protein NKDENANG_03828 [Candidatus Entotheonellaceae bacterium PAL068K]
MAAEDMGINIPFYKLAAFGLSAIFPAIGDGIQAYKVLYIEPDSEFFLQITRAMKLFAMFGGKGTVIGPIIGAIVLYAVQELTWVKLPCAGGGYAWLGANRETWRCVFQGDSG